MATETDHAFENAKASLENIIAMVARLEHAQECDGGDECDLENPTIDINYGVNIFENPESWIDYHDAEQAREAIEEDALSVEVRSDWHTPGDHDNDGASEYMILLTTGGPALRLIGELGAFSQPSSARLEYQDWGTPWTEYITTGSDHAALITYAQQFYFGD